MSVKKNLEDEMLVSGSPWPRSRRQYCPTCPAPPGCDPATKYALLEINTGKNIVIKRLFPVARFGFHI